MEQLSAARARLGLDAYRVQSRRLAVEAPPVSTLPEPAPRETFQFRLGKLQVSILEHAPQAQADIQAMADSLSARRHEDWAATRQAPVATASPSSPAASPSPDASSAPAADAPFSSRRRAAALRAYAAGEGLASRSGSVLGVF